MEISMAARSTITTIALVMAAEWEGQRDGPDRPRAPSPQLAYPWADEAERLRTVF